MFIKQLSIVGFRGFSRQQTLKLALPTGKEGSGLTILVGPNNSGKSTIIEALRIISVRNNVPSFTEGKRNKSAGDIVKISATIESNEILILQTVPEGGSECAFNEAELRKKLNVFVLPSRRTFNAQFSKTVWSRKSVLDNDYFKSNRGEYYSMFERRIFEIQKDPKAFNSILSKVLTIAPKWTIDQADNGQYYIKFNYDGDYHNSEGAGEGLLSIFTIVDALYDSEVGEMIVIDEPELSLHPALQKKVLELLMEYSKDRQIVISTHSPFFISWQSLINARQLTRVIKGRNGIKIHPLSVKGPKIIGGLLSNVNNPHILGLDVKEIFFLDDEINIVEGQEDVIFYKKILDQLGIALKGTFYGWGIGGAGNLNNILIILQSLGFKKINCILDNNMKELRENLSREFPKYYFVCIPTDDVRDKNEVKTKESVSGLIDSGGKVVKPEYKDQLCEIFSNVNNYFQT